MHVAGAWSRVWNSLIGRRSADLCSGGGGGGDLEVGGALPVRPDGRSSAEQRSRARGQAPRKRRQRCRLATEREGRQISRRGDLRRGALAACTHFLLKWAGVEQIASVDLLRSRTHKADSVLEHKRRFGAFPRLDPWPHTALWVVPPAGQVLPAAAAGLLVWHHGTALAFADAMAGMDRSVLED